MKKPLSTYSSLFYSLAGFALALTWALLDIKSVPISQGFLFLSLYSLSLASFAFHLSGEERGTLAHKADEFFIYAVLASLLLAATNDNFWLGLLLALFLLFTAIDLIRRTNLINSFIFVPSLSLSIALALYLNFGASSKLAAALTLALISAIFRLLSQTDLLHALWHLTSASAIFLAFLVLAG